MKVTKFYSFIFFAVIVSGVAFLSSCERKETTEPTVTASSLRNVSALRLNFRFENDVPAPPADPAQVQPELKNALVQADFDQTRPEETLERTIPSPDKKRLLAVYQKFGDTQSTYRLDMYSADGKLIRKVTPNGLAVYYPDTIVWAPDSLNVAFVGIIRTGQPAATPPPNAPVQPQLEDLSNTPADPAPADANANTNTAVNPQTDQPKPVLTFRTEQIYICTSEGDGLKPLTQNEGFVYFYFVWAPDSSALVSLAATWKEWKFLELQAAQRTEIFIPMGRPRLVEKNGRIRLLDDNLTAVRPVWSPDSSKIALAYDKDIRIYDAIGDAPTQAGVPLKNPLLISSKSYDEEMKRKEGIVEANSNSNANSNTNTAAPTPALPQDVNTLPDESTLVSFNPIVELEWTQDNMLYLQTGFVKLFVDQTQNTTSSMRWHRLLLSPQAVKLN